METTMLRVSMILALLAAAAAAPSILTPDASGRAVPLSGRASDGAAERDEGGNRLPPIESEMRRWRTIMSL
jgi:hypothetical protein